MNTTECKQQAIEFQELKSRRVVAAFDGGHVTTDAGALLLREVALQERIIEGFSECFDDHRNPDLIEHTKEELVAQRLWGLVCGYEDLNDHDSLRKDPLFAALVGKADVTGENRERQRDRGNALAGRSTLNRLELSERLIESEERYKKIACDEDKVNQFLLDLFVRSRARRKKLGVLIIDCDATDVPLHGKQEGRFYHGYYDCYCYLPLYLMCDGLPLVAKLRPSNIDASLGTEDELKRIIPELKKRFPGVRIIVRGDSGFAREGIMHFCEENGIDFILGLAKNDRLLELVDTDMEHAREEFEATGKPVRLFTEFRYETLNTWSRKRRVIAKCEHLEKGSNPRFVVTSLTKKAAKAMKLYEQWYCKRGEMENRIKEQFCLFADRLSATVKRANQLRLWFSTVAYIIMACFRAKALRKTALAQAQVDTIRNRLIKIGAQVTVSVRRIYCSMASGFPLQEIFYTAHSAARGP